MRVCIDTNVLVQMFGSRAPHGAIKQSLADGAIEWAVSSEILLEYEEVVGRLSGAARWRQVAEWIELLSALHGNIVRVDPQFRFRAIPNDPDDDKFVDCAIAAAADFVVTADGDFDALQSSGYKPRAIRPEELARQYLAVKPPPRSD